MMLGLPKKTYAHFGAIERIRGWVRERFSLQVEDVVMVSEVACSMPGCPPLETVIAFWTEGTKRHHLKIFKPVEDVTEDDLPPYWMKEALEVGDGFGCDCC
jgi:hypothetical protein